jgi:predicted dehydrogenase
MTHLDAPIGWGLLGTARINRRVIPAIRAVAGAELRAVASRQGDRAVAYAREWAIPASHGSYQALLADPDVDVVYVPLPNSLHVEWTIAALEAGKHVLCEKPLALTVEDVDRVAAAAREAGRIAAEGFMYRHHAQTDAAVHLVRDGAVGRVRVIRGTFTFMLDRQGDVRLKPALGGGSLWDVGCYPVGFARLVCGAEPLEVVGRAEIGPTGVDLAFVGQLLFPDAVRASFDCGFRAAYRTAVEISGSEGTLAIPQPFQPGLDERLRLLHGSEVTEIPVKAGRPLFEDEVDEMTTLVRSGGPPRVTLADTRGNVATLQALYRSAREGRAITM